MATPVIHDGQCAKPPAIEQRVGHKIHTPPLIHLTWARWHDPQMTRPLSTRCESHVQPFFAIESMHPLTVNPPALPSQHHMQSKIPEAGTGVS